MQVKKTAYLALVHPHWICSKWDPLMYSWSNSYVEELEQLSWHTVNQRHQFLSLCQIYKIVHSLDCIQFRDFFTYSLTPSYNNQQLTLSCTTSRINAFRYSFFVRSPFVWNKLPSIVSYASSYQCFKCTLSHYISSLT